MSTNVTIEQFAEAMALLGIDTDNDTRPLVAVHIEAGRITSTYTEAGKHGVQLEETTIGTPNLIEAAQERVVKAHRALMNAQQSLANAVAEAAGAGQRLQDRIDALSPNAQRMVNAFRGDQP